MITSSLGKKDWVEKGCLEYLVFNYKVDCDCK